jgi:hypothetical protein
MQVFTATPYGVFTGECVLDPAIVNRLLNGAREPGPLDSSRRASGVLALMAEVCSNSGLQVCFLGRRSSAHPQHPDEAGLRNRGSRASLPC